MKNAEKRHKGESSRLSAAARNVFHRIYIGTFVSVASSPQEPLGNIPSLTFDSCLMLERRRLLEAPF